VAGLSLDTGNDALRKHFEQFGEVVDAVVMKKWPSGLSRRFGFVTFKAQENADAAVSASHVLDGATLEVTHAVVKGLVHLPTTKLYVAAFPVETTEDELRRHFSEFGQVDSVEIMFRDGISRGFGFVIFSDIEGARAALSQSHTIRDRKIVVKIAEPKGFFDPRARGPFPPPPPFGRFPPPPYGPPRPYGRFGYPPDPSFPPPPMRGFPHPRSIPPHYDDRHFPAEGRFGGDSRYSDHSYPESRSSHSSHYDDRSSDRYHRDHSDSYRSSRDRHSRSSSPSSSRSYHPYSRR
jgi:RNA recognition motif-containing protein